MSEYVYVFHVRGTQTYKVGTSVDAVHDRLRAMKTYLAKAYCFFRGEVPDGSGMTVEAEAHAMLAPYRRDEREMFYDVPDDVRDSAIEGIKRASSSSGPPVLPLERVWLTAQASQMLTSFERARDITPETCRRGVEDAEKDLAHAWAVVERMQRYLDIARRLEAATTKMYAHDPQGAENFMGALRAFIEGDIDPRSDRMLADALRRRPA